MQHVAIDLGGMISQICIRNAKGEIVEEHSWSTASLPKFLKELMPPSRVIVETCAEAFAVADAALAVGHEVRVVPATLARSLGVGQRGIKTDTRDARLLSEVSARIDLPSVHIPSATSRQLKTICGMRDALVRTRTKLINTVRGWLRTQTRRIRGGAVETFTQRVRIHFERQGESLSNCLIRQLIAIEALQKQIFEADAELAALAKADEICQRLMTVPGVGPISAVRYIAALDEVSRFGDAHHVESYIGLTPGEDSSSERVRRTSITKAGSRHLRWTLIQAAWSLKRCRPKDPVVVWCLEVEKRRGKRIAITALARKLAGILFAIWRDGTTYDPNRGASA